MRFAVMIAIMLGLLVEPAHAAAVTVTLAASARVATETVTVAQVATLGGPEGAVKLIGQVVLVPSMRSGTVATVTAAQVAAALAAAGFDLRMITVAGATAVTVRRDTAGGAPSAPGAPPAVAAAPAPLAPPQLLVTRGSTVQVVAAVGPIRVTTPGIALGSGAQGQVIAVRVLATRRVVTAIVVGRGQVAAQL